MKVKVNSKVKLQAWMTYCAVAACVREAVVACLFLYDLQKI